MKSFFILSLVFVSVTASAETDPRPKLLDLYYKGSQPSLDQMRSIRIGRCYNVDAKELRTLGGLFIGKAIDGQNGPLFEESDLVKFWAYSDEDSREFDNFPAKDYLNGNYSFNRYEFDNDGYGSSELRNSAFRSQNGWTQVKRVHQPGYNNGQFKDNVYRVSTRTVMRARMNGKYLLTAYGEDYETFAAKEKCRGIFDRYCYNEKTNKKIGSGFDITEICYFYRRID